ncbi:TlpA family protein disulfide reductase [Oleiharenicola lentus]|uniref:TlpA family protein disulfide reductase n=1 Tax=Oleiharenicola lentus TaxID=2508720 RepID=UPI003F66C8A4
MKSFRSLFRFSALVGLSSVALALVAQETVSSTPPPVTPAAAPAVPAIDPAATALWREHINGMGDRGSGEKNVNYGQVINKALEFFQKYPTERRVGGILFNVASFGEWIKGDDAPRVRKEWRAFLQNRLVETLRDDTWPDNVWSGLHWVAAKNDLAIQLEAGGKPDLAALKARIATVAARAPAAPYRTFMEQEYLRQLEQHEPAAVEAHLVELSKNEIPDLANLGNGQLAIHALKTTPMELKFTALDGSEVDISTLRGKVVLIDCWATWCVPCIKELPNIKAARAKWGDKGFVVVGISFDRIADRAKLVKFVADEKLDWPHWFNEAGGPNPFGKKYNIRSIPATFLLGKDGLLVTTETHGAKLDEALTKLLGP